MNTIRCSFFFFYFYGWQPTSPIFRGLALDQPNGFKKSTRMALPTRPTVKKK